MVNMSRRPSSSTTTACWTAATGANHIRRDWLLLKLFTWEWSWSNRSSLVRSNWSPFWMRVSKACTYCFSRRLFYFSQVLDPNTLNLDPDPGFCPLLIQIQSYAINFEKKQKIIILEKSNFLFKKIIYKNYINKMSHTEFFCQLPLFILCWLFLTCRHSWTGACTLMMSHCSAPSHLHPAIRDPTHRLQPVFGIHIHWTRIRPLNLDPDPSCFLTQAGIKWNYFIIIKCSQQNKSIARYNVLKIKLFSDDLIF